MNFNKKAALLLVIVVILIMTLVPLQSNASTPALHVEGNKIKDSSGNVAILRGISMIDIGAEEKLYGGILKNIDRLTNKNDTSGSSPGWYPKVLRIPVIPYDSGFQSPVPFKVGDDTLYNTLLRPAIDYCKQKDIYVILDWHYIDNTGSHVQTTNDFWRYMAPKFANDTNVLFELYNEPIDGGNWSSVRTNMQNWYNIVRAAAPNNLILVGTPNWCQILTPVISNPISGTNIVYVTHIYCTHWYAGSVRNEVDALYKVYPVMMTEWGFSQSNEAPGSIAYGSISDYGQPLMDFMEARGVSNTAWCANYEWGPPMFWKDWTLRVGPGEMGGFVKDQLYKMRNNSTPGGFGNVSTPTPTGRNTPTPTPIPGTISIAAGSSSAVGSFQADQYYSGGSTYSNSNTVDVSQVTSNPPPAALFNNERYGAFSYTIPGLTVGSSYAVTLYFAETYLTSSGSRRFNVSINGVTVLSNFDIYASAGGQNKAIARSFTATANSSGQIVIQFTSGTENPKINGISIKPDSNPTPTPAPSSTATPTGIVNTPTPTASVTPTNTPTPTRQNTPTPTPTRGVVTATPMATPLPTGTYVKFRNVATGLYIDGMGSTSNGANVCQYSSSASNNQQWTLEAAGSYYKIKNRATGLYLDGMGRTSNGSICGQWSSSSSNNQQWTQETVGSYVKYKNRATGLYLDGMGSTANGSNLCQWSSSSSTNQQWQKQ